MTRQTFTVPDGTTPVLDAEGRATGDLATPDTVGDALPREMARVRDVVMPAYQEIGAAGQFALTLMRHDLDRAAKAMVSGDVVGMIEALKSLREYEL